MKPTKPQLGAVIRYEYLWLSDSQKGHESGTKERPCAVVLTNADGLVKVLPITHTRPDNLFEAIEIPTKVKARLGLDSEKSWIICSELNEFRWPGPDLRPLPHNSETYQYGMLPPALFNGVVNKLIYLAKGRQLNIVARSE